jgi:pyruvate-formate lyase-activating enzyme
MGDELWPPWRVCSQAHYRGVLHLEFQDDRNQVVMFRISPRSETSGLPPARSGPFDVPQLAVAYQPGPVPFEALAPLGRALAARLANVTWAELTTADAHWRQRLRAHLLAHPTARARLGDWLPAEALPAWPCVLPWTRLELSQGGVVGPCCAEYQARRWPLSGGLDALWNGEAMQAFRRAMASQNLASACRSTCPILRGGSERPADLRLHGGAAALVDAQLAVVDAMLAGDLQVAGAPLAMCFTVTSFCNYDCLMCPLGVEGTLDDELQPAFYEALEQWLPRLLVLEVNGGEPFASPHFRAFVERLDRAALPQLRLNVVTNASYLSGKQLQRFAQVPWGQVTVSLNAATPETYALVNRGLSWERIRPHLDALRAQTQEITYSMVILRQNLQEIELFADLAEADGVAVRFLLPFRDRHGASVMTELPLMRAALASLERVLARLQARGRLHEARGVEGSVLVLRERLSRGLATAL